MKTYKIKVAYDGTDYYGWQYQPDQKTITGTLQDRFRAVFNSPIIINGASRTDAGVHALGQIARFCTEMDIEPSKLMHAWNNLLPRDILIRSLSPVAENFNPQYDALEKTYFYHLFTKRPLPVASRYGWFYKQSLDLEKLEDYLQVFVGTHDFRSFCSGHEQESTIRTINSISVRYLNRFKTYQVVIKGPGFLRYMIRRIVGACVQVASSKNRSITELSDALEKKDPQQTLIKAPACGLMLYKIRYK